MSGRGRFITLEGIEGAGKTTQLDLMKSCLAGHGIPVIVTREPGGSPIAERIREVLLDPECRGMATDAELLLMFAARAEHLAHKVQPALAQGTWVLCDRFTDATYAYQGGGRGIDARRISVLEDYVQGSLRPDLTLLFDLPVQQGLTRAGRRSAPDRFESETLHFFERVRAAYLDLAERNPRRIHVLDASVSEADVSLRARRLIGELIGRLR